MECIQPLVVLKPMSPHLTAHLVLEDGLQSGPVFGIPVKVAERRREVGDHHPSVPTVGVEHLVPIACHAHPCDVQIVVAIGRRKLETITRVFPPSAWN